MKTTEDRIRQSLNRLAGQNGDMLTLSIGTLVKVRGGKNHLKREDVAQKEEALLSNLSHVSAATSEEHGTCLRLVFDQQMYATCGTDAKAIIDWANDCGKTDVKKTIENFPEVRFQKVEGRVKMRDKELVLA